MPHQIEQRIQKAQKDLETTRNSTEKIEEFSKWIGEATNQTDQLCQYYTGLWSEDREHEESLQYEASGEDEIYDAITEYEAALRELARVSVLLVTREN